MASSGPHPEAATDEKWVGNVEGDVVPAHVRHIATARIGRVAYDIDGKALAGGYDHPLFIGRADLDEYDRVMMARFNRINGSGPTTGDGRGKVGGDR